MLGAGNDLDFGILYNVVYKYEDRYVYWLMLYMTISLLVFYLLLNPTSCLHTTGTGTVPP